MTKLPVKIKKIVPELKLPANQCKSLQCIKKTKRETSVVLKFMQNEQENSNFHPLLSHSSTHI